MKCLYHWCILVKGTAYFDGCFELPGKIATNEGYRNLREALSNHVKLPASDFVILNVTLLAVTTEATT